MPELTIRTRDHRVLLLDTAAVEGSAVSLRGVVLTPAASADKAARLVWNVMLARRSAWMAWRTDTADVMQAVHFVREHGLLAAVHDGGHPLVGTAVCERGFRIELAPR